MGRAILLVLDSVGCGGAPDAAEFGDSGANTLGHIAIACANDQANDGRNGPLKLPNLDQLGLGAAIRLASDLDLPGLAALPGGLWGVATEKSRGKDTPSGHWELSGVPVPWDWHYFPRETPAFPAALMSEFCQRTGLDHTLCNAHGSGVPVLEEFGEEHTLTGAPICYTSADSVFQIAAHEESFGLNRLLKICEIAAKLVHPMKVGRVIARPFVGSAKIGFTRTANRRDFAIAPPEPTLLDRVITSGGSTHCIGKINDIFAGHGVSHILKGKDDMALVDQTCLALNDARDGDMIFANYVEFDSLYGHRRDVSGYARALEAFDTRLPEITRNLRQDDLLIITADHGNDPTWLGTDHTRERVPVLGIGKGLKPIGHVGFADVGESLAAHLGLKPGQHGTSFL